MIEIFKPETALSVGDSGVCSIDQLQLKKDREDRRRLGIPPYEDLKAVIGAKSLVFKVRALDGDPWVYVYKLHSTRASFNCNPTYFERHFKFSVTRR